nr:hypothetical protein [Tanacetum cinerariifolium]
MVGMPISTGITASVPYVNDNGVSPLFDLIMDSFCKIFMNMSYPCVPFFFHHSLARFLTFSKYLTMPGSFAMLAIKASYSTSLLVTSNLNLRAYVNSIPSRPNGDALWKCILEGPYTLTIVVVPAVPKTKDSPAVPKHTTVETLLNISLENKAHYQSKKEEAIERLQHGESLNIQDVKTNLYWEFGKFTSHDEETMESYYTRFYKLMNEMIGNNLTVATMPVNVQFLQQLQPKWSRCLYPSMNHVHTFMKHHYWTLTLVVSQTSTFITGASSLILSSSRSPTILDYVTNLLVISALYSVWPTMVRFALVA